MATIPRADVEPDYPGGWKHGVRGWFLKKSGKSEFAPDDWGAIAAWAWGLSRALDYLETDKDIDAKRVAVIGHSRMGKAALWAGATDERFALTISNNSGEGGAALARRWFGETTAIINDHFPHWFCGNFKAFDAATEKLPFDQHGLIALCAPRPVLLSNAEEDLWANPDGQFALLHAAAPVYALFGEKIALPAPRPPTGELLAERLGYYIRPGKHSMTAADWKVWCDYADKFLKRGD